MVLSVTACALSMAGAGLLLGRDVVRDYLGPVFVIQRPQEAAPACPELPRTEAPWLAAGPPTPDPLPLPAVPASLERRVAFWQRVWGENGDRQTFLVDERRPWIIHAAIDCDDLYAGAPDEAPAKASCGQRITQARQKAIANLKKGAKTPAQIALFDGDATLAKTAAQHVIGVGGRKDALARATARAAPHLGHAESLFAAEDVPPVFARASIVESLWRPEALSRSGAAGAFQFMPKTGAAFLQVKDGVVDERFDPLRSSWAAARYLKQMHKRFGSWDLVLTAYNTGPSRLARVMKIRGTKDLGKIADAGDVGEYGFDGQNYYAQIVAIARLTRADRFEQVPPSGHAVTIDAPISFETLAQCTGTPAQKLRVGNPALDESIVVGDGIVPAGYVAFVPREPLTTAQR